MAISQQQLRELAGEALAACQAWDGLTSALLELQARETLSPEAKVALLAFILRDLPVVGAPKSEETLAHIRRTEERNRQRAQKARRLRAEKERSER